MSAVASTPPAESLTIFDRIGALLTALSIAALVVLPTYTFGPIFDDLIPRNALPLLTRIFLSPWSALVLVLPAVVCLGLGLRPRHPIGRRRAWIAAAFGLTTVGYAVLLVAMYLPVFSLAQQIKAD